MGSFFTNFLIAFFAAQIEVHSLMSIGVLFQALLASLMNEHFTRSVLPTSMRSPFVTALVEQSLFTFLNLIGIYFISEVH